MFGKYTNILITDPCLSRTLAGKSTNEALETLSAQFQQEIRKEEQQRQAMHDRISRGGSIARALESTEDRVGSMGNTLTKLKQQVADSEYKTEKATERLAQMEGQVSVLQGENRELRQQVADAHSRISALEQRSPRPRAPYDEVTYQASASQMEDLQRQIRELRKASEARDVEVEQLKRSKTPVQPTEGYHSSASTKLTMAKENANTIGYVRTSDESTLPWFADFATDLRALEAYAYPTCMHKEFSLLLTAVAMKCRLDQSCHKL